MKKWRREMRFIARQRRATLIAGYWLVNKFRLQCRQQGVRAAAKNLRKQGVPLAFALEMVRAL